MVTNCLTKAYSYLPSFSEESRSYCKRLARAGTVFTAGAFLGWNAFVNQELFSLKNVAVSVLGAYAFSGKSLPVFQDLQSRVERLHKEIVEANPAYIQKNLQAYKARCLTLGRELVRLPEAKRTPYQVSTLVRIRDFCKAADSKTRLDLLSQLKRLYSYELKQKRLATGLAFNSEIIDLGRIIIALFIWNYNRNLPILKNPLVLGAVALVPYILKEFYLLNFSYGKKVDMVKFAHNNDLTSLKELTGTKDHRAFKRCQDVPSFFRRLFPTTTSKLPQDWALKVNRLQKPLVLVKFEKEAEVLLKNKAQFVSLESLTGIVERTNNCSVDALVELLKIANPLFKRAWELAGKPQFKECPKSKVKSARYLPRRHIIEINQEYSVVDKILGMLFEIINALQRYSQHEIVALASDQNEAALLTEWLEHFSSNWRRKAADPMGIIYEPDTFQQFWKRVNTPQKWDFANITHAEDYRIRWMIEYIFDNPGFLDRRLRELQ